MRSITLKKPLGHQVFSYGPIARLDDNGNIVSKLCFVITAITYHDQRPDDCFYLLNGSVLFSNVSRSKMLYSNIVYCN